MFIKYHFLQCKCKGKTFQINYYVLSNESSWIYLIYTCWLNMTKITLNVTLNFKYINKKILEMIKLLTFNI